MTKKEEIFTIILIILSIFIAIYNLSTTTNKHNISEEIVEESIELEITEKESVYIDKNDLEIAVNQDDLYLLAKLITLEANPNSDEDMICVGNVVLNRVESDLFPNTISEVIYQTGQYSCTWSGAWSWRKPSDRALEIAEVLLISGANYTPDNVLFQAGFKQGNGVWKIIGNHYYCYY